MSSLASAGLWGSTALLPGRLRAGSAALLRSRGFVLGLVFRLAFLPWPGSSYARQLFIPFLDSGVAAPLSNPWLHHPPHYFPYGSALYALLLLPRLLATALLGSSVVAVPWVGMVLLKLPLLGLDLLLLRCLCALAPRRQKALVGLYWLNPVLFFITYVHGQLDLAAMSLVVAALWALCRDRTKTSAVLLALATLCKAHVLAVMPLLLVALWKRYFVRQATRQIAAWCAIYLGLVTLGFWPHARAAVLSYVTTASPEAFRMFAMQLDMGAGQRLYLGVSITLAVLGRLCISTRLSRSGLLYGSGVLFGTLVLTTSAMPGWYAWVMPFYCLFFAQYTIAPRSLLYAANALYLGYFGLLSGDSALLHVELPMFWQTGVFTVMQTAFAGLTLSMWRMAAAPEAPLRGRARPFLLGIAGDSGTGKNVLSEILADLFEGKVTTILEGDDYHKWERGHQSWNDYTHLHPKANHLEALASHASELAAGRLIFHPAYDHRTGQFTEPREKRSGGLLIVQGLHTLYLRQMRRQLDLRIFTAPHELVQLAWKLRRDVHQRNSSKEKVLQVLTRRRADAEKHINPQRDLADWIIEMEPAEPIERAAVLAGAQPTLRIRYTLYNDAPVTELFEALRSRCAAELDVQLAGVPGDIDRICLQVCGNPSAPSVQEVADHIFPHMRTITRGRRPPRFRGGLDGVTQLVALTLFDKQVLRAHSNLSPN